MLFRPIIIAVMTLFSLATVLPLAGCGYSFQTSKNPLADKEGIRKVFIDSMTNNTYKPGVENQVYIAVLQTLAVHKRVIIVSHKEDADAVLKGYVNIASYAADASAVPSNNSSLPGNLSGESLLVATEYVATLSCSFVLERTHAESGQRKVVWTSGFSRTTPFGASNQIGVYGATSALINESEFDRALGEMSQSMSEDVHESMLDMF
jgi:hypothetical protein